MYHRAQANPPLNPSIDSPRPRRTQIWSSSSPRCHPPVSADSSKPAPFSIAGLLCAHGVPSPRSLSSAAQHEAATPPSQPGVVLSLRSASAGAASLPSISTTPPALHHRSSSAANKKMKEAARFDAGKKKDRIKKVDFSTLEKETGLSCQREIGKPAWACRTKKEMGC